MAQIGVNLILAFPSPEGWVREHRFHSVREWLFDYAHPEAKVAVEIHGSTFTQGRHTRGRGFAEDREKMNAAALAGWVVLEYTTGQVAREWGRVVDEVMAAVQARKEAVL